MRGIKIPLQDFALKMQGGLMRNSIILPTDHVPLKYVTKLINSGQIRSCNHGCSQIEEAQNQCNCLVHEMNKRSPSVDIFRFRL